ncbi:glycosyltransferase [Marinobacter salexigens]|uniref:Glycosyltransferase n=1 Tax=Marinobacter salexigens TaxID=1925763 RepID=A0ABS6AC60_9GAMM|nr:glycosyltransferase [Marinobacter salexigens]
MSGEKSSLNVLQFYRTYMPESQGGVEEAIRQICIATGEHGVRHRVLTLARVDQVDIVERPEATVIRAPLQWEPASCSMGLALFRLYREHAQWADVIHIHYPWPFADLVHVLSAIDKPVVITYHSDILRQRYLEQAYRPLRTWFFSQVQRIIATSPDYMASSPVLQKLAAKCEVIPLGLSPDTYEPVQGSTLDSVRETYGEGFFLFVGVLRYYKGLHTLLEAAAKSGLPVVIAGAGPEEEWLRKRAQELDCSSVVFAGFVADEVRAALYTLCRAVVFPSFLRSEAFGVTLLEGQLYSRALISCDIGTGTSFVNKHGETGVVIPPEDPDALAEAMRQLDGNPELAERYGKAGRLRLDTVFSGERVGAEYARVYQSVVSPSLFDSEKSTVRVSE